MELTSWDVNEQAWPLNGNEREKLRFLLQFAMLAPSGHNTQPWQFKLSDHSVELYADRSRRLPVVDPQDRELIISCGCALYFLRVAARRFDHRLTIDAFPEHTSVDLLARVNLTPAEPATKSEHAMFTAIARRRTNRHPFDKRDPDSALVKQLTHLAEEQNTWLEVVSDPQPRHSLAELIAMGNRLQASDKAFRKELASWVHPNSAKHADGIPGYAFGLGDLLSHLGPFLLRTFDWGNKQAEKDKQRALEAPLLAVLGSQTDSPRSWLETGQALATLVLYATTHGLSASYFNQPIEVVHLRREVGQILKAKGYPQIILRLGYGPDVKPTPRRNIEQALLKH